MNEKGISLVQLRQRKTRQTAALFLAPVIILLVVFIAYPIIDTFITSGIPVEWYFRRQEDGRTCKLGKTDQRYKILDSI